MADEKNCKNCRYYMFHYVKADNYLLKLSEGHCTNDNLFPYLKDRNKVYTDCKFWEPIAIQKDERKETIINVLRNMEKSLRDIKEILCSDEE